MEETQQQLDAVLAEWRDATEPLDGKSSVDPSFFTTTGSTSWLSSSSSLKATQRALTTREADDEPHIKNGIVVVGEKSCRPWSHADFLKRVSSFSIGTWFAKPDAISVFACARHGWSNTSQPDQLYCPWGGRANGMECLYTDLMGSCEQYLCFRIDAKLSDKGALNVANAFAKLLVTGHSSLCPWRENPSPEAFTTLPIASLAQVSESLVKRIEQSIAAASLSSSDATVFDAISALNVDERVVRKIVARQEIAAASESERQRAQTEAIELKTFLVKKFEDLVDRPASSSSSGSSSSAFLFNVALLSVCGWQLELEQEDETSGVMWCETCNRRWSVSNGASSSWSSVADPADAGEASAVAERSTKRQKLTHVALNPIAQHRWFCPWVSARKQEASHQLGLTVDDDVAKFGENDARLWDFMLLPGWKQYAKALHLLSDSSSSTDEGRDTTQAKKTKPAIQAFKSGHESECSKPEQALESVRAVLGLPDW